MALRNLTSSLIQLNRAGVRSFSVSQSRPFILSWLFGRGKVMPNNQEVGFERIATESKKLGEDPLEQHHVGPHKVVGSGTKNDPYIIESRNEERLVFLAEKDQIGTPKHIWVTLKEGGRSPIDGSYFKLEQITEDKYGINELDITLHH